LTSVFVSHVREDEFQFEVGQDERVRVGAGQALFEAGRLCVEFVTMLCVFVC